MPSLSARSARNLIIIIRLRSKRGFLLFMRETGKKSRIFSKTRTVPEISFSILINLRPLYLLKTTKHSMLSKRKKKKNKRS